MNRVTVPSEILEGRIIAVARKLPPGTAVATARALRRGGISVIEITLDGAGAIGQIEELASQPVLVGAGTVMNRAGAAAAVAAGARFLVSPHTDEALVEWARQRRIPFVPGAYTPTEVVSAWDSGASAVKVFPAAAGGPELVKMLLGPFSEIPLVPTGGVTAASAPDYLAAGAVAVGLGGWLTGSGDPDLIEARAREVALSLLA